MEGITSKNILQHLRLDCSSYGSGQLRLEPRIVGTSDGNLSWRNPHLHHHSCRWSSDAFLPQTSFLNEFFQKTPSMRNHRNNAKTRQILDAAKHNGHSYWLSPCTPNWRTGRRNTINGGASISDRRRRRRGIAEGEEWGELKNNLSIPNPNQQRTYCALLCLIAVQRGVCLRSCFVWEDSMPRATVKVDIYGGLNP